MASDNVAFAGRVDEATKRSLLSAARGLRPYGEGPDATGVEASFDAGSARRIAAHHNGKHDVNPDVSANGKGPAGTDLRAAFGAEPRAMRK